MKIKHEVKLNRTEMNMVRLFSLKEYNNNCRDWNQLLW